MILSPVGYFEAEAEVESGSWSGMGTPTRKLVKRWTSGCILVSIYKYVYSFVFWEEVVFHFLFVFDFTCLQGSPSHISPGSFTYIQNWRYRWKTCRGSGRQTLWCNTFWALPNNLKAPNLFPCFLSPYNPKVRPQYLNYFSMKDVKVFTHTALMMKIYLGAEMCASMKTEKIRSLQSGGLSLALHRCPQNQQD